MRKITKTLTVASYVYAVEPHPLICGHPRHLDKSCLLTLIRGVDNFVGLGGGGC